MNTSQTKMDAAKLAGFLLTAGVLLLLFHVYIICYGIIHLKGLEGKLARIFYLIGTRLPFVAGEMQCKLAVWATLVLSTIPSIRPSDRKLNLLRPLIFLCLGLLLFFSTVKLTPVGHEPLLAEYYAAITFLGFFIIIGSQGMVSRALNYGFRSRRFRKDTSGFRQEERLIETDYSINFPARYPLNGRVRGSYVNIINPRRGVLVMGGPGSGKSWFIIEPAINQLLGKGMALFVYDFKYPALTSHTYSCFTRHLEKYPSSACFYSINFTDLSRSCRCNVIDPATLQYKSDALDISRTILLSINKSWLAKQGEFFVESPINFLAALIWWLKVYKGGIYCTLPHVIELSKTSYEELFTILNAEPSTRGLVTAFREAYLNKTMEMLDGQISSARIPLARLDSPDFYYVLSGDDVNLDINDPTAPVVLCLGSDSARHVALAPAISLFIDRLNRRINQAGRHPTALILDEFATVRATSILTTVATGRSNNITPILALQDLSQLKSQYTHDEANQILNTTGNLICGQVNGETADWVSKRFQTMMELKTTISISSSDTSSVSKTEQIAETMSPATLANLSSGEFAGLIADDPSVKIDLKGFHSTFIKSRANTKNQQSLPVVRPVDDKVIQATFNRISTDITDLVASEMKRILNDPQLRKFVVKT
jgi:hypothetical protein